MYQGSLKQAHFYAVKAKEVLERDEINFNVKSEVIINISVAFLENNPQYGYDSIKEELEKIENKYNQLKIDINKS